MFPLSSKLCCHGYRSLYNFDNMRATELFYHFIKVEVHILRGLENISIFNIWKL